MQINASLLAGFARGFGNFEGALAGVFAPVPARFCVAMEASLTSSLFAHAWFTENPTDADGNDSNRITLCLFSRPAQASHRPSQDQGSLPGALVLKLLLRTKPPLMNSPTCLSSLLASTSALRAARNLYSTSQGLHHVRT